MAKQPETTAAAPAADKRAKFKELANARVSKSIAAIRGVGKLANPKAYAFEQPDVDKIVGAYTAEIDALKSRFEKALTGTVAADRTEFEL